ncbi:MAG: helix-turn-helix transcriptional regulator [Cellulomonadaceae bacterium]|nr:helix-turn-helix transcriptional regulator [Cellulomonadaceae bacterium]
MEVGRALGARLRDHRAELGLTQEQVAELAGISRNYYGSLEAGYADRVRREPANPTLTVLRGLAYALRCSIGALVDCSTTAPRTHANR